MNEKTNKAGATSGQNVPKSPKSKFRHKSQQEQTAASKLRMEKRGEKLEKAIETLCSIENVADIADLASLLAD